MLACNVVVTLLKDEQINFTVGITFPMPQSRKRIHRGILHFRVAGIALGLTFQSDTFVRIGLCIIGVCSSLARHGCLLATSLHFCVRFLVQVLCVCHHHVFKSFPAFRGVSLPRHRQSGAVDFAGWASCRVTNLFRVCCTDVDIAGLLVVAVIRFGRSRFNVWQIWDDQHRLRQISRNIAWVRLPRRSTDVLQQSVVVSLLFWDSSHGLNSICPSLVHDTSITMRSVVFTRTPTNTPLDHLDSNLCRVRFRQSTHSPNLGSSTFQGLPFKRK